MSKEKQIKEKYKPKKMGHKITITFIIIIALIIIIGLFGRNYL